MYFSKGLRTEEPFAMLSGTQKNYVTHKGARLLQLEPPQAPWLRCMAPHACGRAHSGGQPPSLVSGSGPLRAEDPSQSNLLRVREPIKNNHTPEGCVKKPQSFCLSNVCTRKDARCMRRSCMHILQARSPRTLDHPQALNPIEALGTRTLNPTSLKPDDA